MTDLTSLTLTQAREALRKKEFSATELAEAHIAAVERARALNAFVVEAPERARAMARASDGRLAKGEAGPLEGLPLKNLRLDYRADRAEFVRSFAGLETINDKPVAEFWKSVADK